MGVEIMWHLGAGPLNFVWHHLIFSTQLLHFFPQCPQYETRFMSPFWHLECEKGSFWQILDPCHMLSNGHFHKLRLGKNAE